MHDRFGNEVKVGDEVRYLGNAVLPGRDGKWHQVERQGVVARQMSNSDTCNIEVLTAQPSARWAVAPGQPSKLDPTYPVLAVAVMVMTTAKESAVVVPIDGRGLLSDSGAPPSILAGP